MARCNASVAVGFSIPSRNNSCACALSGHDIAIAGRSLTSHLRPKALPIAPTAVSGSPGGGGRHGIWLVTWRCDETRDWLSTHEIPDRDRAIVAPRGDPLCGGTEPEAPAGGIDAHGRARHHCASGRIGWQNPRSCPVRFCHACRCPTSPFCHFANCAHDPPRGTIPPDSPIRRSPEVGGVARPQRQAGGWAAPGFRSRARYTDAPARRAAAD